MNRAVAFVCTAGVAACLAAFSLAFARGVDANGGSDDLFAKRRTDDGWAVAAERTGVRCAHALEQLALTMSWPLTFETDRLRVRLDETAVDLAFRELEPRAVFHLLAVAGGADVVFDDRTRNGATTTDVVVVAAPSAVTEAGRQRLRRFAIPWYRRFLADGLPDDPLLRAEGGRARMALADLLRAEGALEDAAEVYLSLRDAVAANGRGRSTSLGDGTEADIVARALLRVAECRFELGDYEAAEEHARAVARMHPSRPETATGTAMLGRVLLATGRPDECVRELTAAWVPLADSGRIIELYLLVAEAWFELRRPQPVATSVARVDHAFDWRRLPEQQLHDYLFLRGYGLAGAGRLDEAAAAFELFLGLAPNHRRRGEGWTLLARVCYRGHRYLAARAAALESAAYRDAMDAVWIRDSNELVALSALELGDRDVAFARLEEEARAEDSDPELVEFLIDQLMKAGRHQRAILVARTLERREAPWADRARLLQLEAMRAQAESAGAWASFASRAIPVAVRLEAEPSQREAATLIAEAWETAGEFERAADAVRGILR